VLLLFNFTLTLESSLAIALLSQFLGQLLGFNLVYEICPVTEGETNVFTRSEQAHFLK